MSETNYEHYRNEIIDLINTAWQERAMCTFARKHLHNGNCKDVLCTKCKEAVAKWLKAEYRVEIDWSKVPVDTPVYVSDDCEFPDENNFHRYFKCFNGEEETRFECFQFGATSWSCGKTYAAANAGWNWRYCSLARPEDIEKYKKE